MISLIIPYYNRISALKALINDLSLQTSNNWELILINDGGEQFKDDFSSTISVNVIHLERPSQFKPGGCGARNYGLTLATHEYVQFFDSDDRVCEDFISERINQIEMNDSIVLWNLSGDPPASEHDCLVKLSRKYVIANTPSLTIKREFCPLWDESLVRSQDYLFGIELFGQINDVMRICYFESNQYEIITSNDSISSKTTKRMKLDRSRSRIKAAHTLIDNKVFFGYQLYVKYSFKLLIQKILLR